MKKIFFLISGTIALALGAVGVLLPILPTTPFLLLASFCFLRGSAQLDCWFKNTKLYLRHVKPIGEGKGISLKAKLSILGSVYIMLGVLFFTVPSTMVKIIIILLLTMKTIVFTRIKTLREE